MSDFLHGTWTIAALELRQRVRSLAWYVLLGIFAVLLIIVTVLASAAFITSPDQLRGAYSVVVYFVLLLVVLVTPALSGNAINGDRDAATLAPVQVTLVTTGADHRSASSSPRGSRGSLSSPSPFRSWRSRPSRERSRRARSPCRSWFSSSRSRWSPRSASGSPAS